MVITLWVLYTFFGILVFSLAFLWAVRARQFWHQDRARYLALDEEEPVSEANAPGGLPAAVIVPGVILAAALVLLVVTLVLSYARG